MNEMSKSIPLAAILVLVFAGCLTKAERENKPIKVSESDGVTVWRIRDDTPGGSRFIYYTTPAGHLLSK